MIRYMTYEDVIKYFGSAAEAARKIGVKPPSVSEWRHGIPVLRQLHIERVTNGVLKADQQAA